MSELTSKTIAQLRDGFRDGEFSAREIADSFNAAVEAGRALNAWTVETPELALAAADAADKARAGNELKPLSGIPRVTIPDVWCVCPVRDHGCRCLRQRVKCSEND